MNIGTMDKTAIYRMMVVVAFFTAIAGACLIIISPFLPAILLALIFTLSTWPAFTWMEHKLEGRTTLAAALMTILLALCFILPLVFLGGSLAENFTRFVTSFINALQNKPEEVPAWIADMPYIGPYAASAWADSMTDRQSLVNMVRSSAGPASQWLLGTGATIGRGILDLSLGVIIAFFFFRHGVQAEKRLSILIEKFLGTRGQRLMRISKQTVVGVVYGMLGTALAQGTLAGIGFAIAGIPGAAFLGMVTFVLSFLPMGPPLVWVPAAVWLFMQHEIGMGIFMIIWGVLLISAIDNVIRPYFISLGSNLPLLIVLMGVFGGIIAFGFIGIFIGPTLLAVAYTLIMEWSHARVPEQDQIILS